MPGQPDRHVALKRRETSELIAEELRRLDPDDIYRATVQFGVKHLVSSGEDDGDGRRPGQGGRRPGQEGGRVLGKGGGGQVRST